jgi:hypothetical protein
MVNIKTTLCSENTCGLLIENTTGYYHSLNNPTGFFTLETPAALKEYRIDDVYQFTYLIKNNWDGTFTNIPIAGNTGKMVIYNINKTYAMLMEEGAINQHFLFSTDGYYSIYQFAIPKESIKISVGAAAPYTYYVKPDLTVWLDYNNISSQVDLYSTLISCNTNWNLNNIVMLRSNMVSKCFLENCFNAVLEVFSKYYTDPLCIRNSTELKQIRDKRDLLYAVTNTIQYYVELGQYYQAAKLIYDISYCNICKDYLTTTSSVGCGCS